MSVLDLSYHTTDVLLIVQRLADPTRCGNG